MINLRPNLRISANSRMFTSYAYVDEMTPAQRAALNLSEEQECVEVVGEFLTSYHKGYHNPEIVSVQLFANGIFVELTEYDHEDVMSEIEEVYSNIGPEAA